MKTIDVNFKDVEFVEGDEDLKICGNWCHPKCIFNTSRKDDCLLPYALTGINCINKNGYFRFKEKWEPLTVDNIKVGAEVRVSGSCDLFFNGHLFFKEKTNGIVKYVAPLNNSGAFFIIKLFEDNLEYPLIINSKIEIKTR